MSHNLGWLTAYEFKSGKRIMLVGWYKSDIKIRGFGLKKASRFNGQLSSAGFLDKFSLLSAKKLVPQLRYTAHATYGPVILKAGVF